MKRNKPTPPEKSAIIKKLTNIRNWYARMLTAPAPPQVTKRLLIRRIFYGCTHHEIGPLCALRLFTQLFFRTIRRIASALVYNSRDATLAQLAEQSLRK